MSYIESTLDEFEKQASAILTGGYIGSQTAGEGHEAAGAVAGAAAGKGLALATYPIHSEGYTKALLGEKGYQSLLDSKKGFLPKYKAQFDVAKAMFKPELMEEMMRKHPDIAPHIEGLNKAWMVEDWKKFKPLGKAFLRQNLLKGGIGVAAGLGAGYLAKNYGWGEEAAKEKRQEEIALLPKPQQMIEHIKDNPGLAAAAGLGTAAGLGALYLGNKALQEPPYTDKQASLGLGLASGTLAGAMGQTEAMRRMEAAQVRKEIREDTSSLGGGAVRGLGKTFGYGVGGSLLGALAGIGVSKLKGAPASSWSDIIDMDNGANFFQGGSAFADQYGISPENANQFIQDAQYALAGGGLGILAGGGYGAYRGYQGELEKAERAIALHGKKARKKTAGIPMRPLLGDTVIGGLLGATSGYAVKEDPTILNRLGITDQKNYSELGALLGVVGGAAIGGRHASKLKALNKAKQIVKANPKPPKVEAPLAPKVEAPLAPKVEAPKLSDSEQLFNHLTKNVGYSEAEARAYMVVKEEQLAAAGRKLVFDADKAAASTEKFNRDYGQFVDYSKELEKQTLVSGKLETKLREASKDMRALQNFHNNQKLKMSDEFRDYHPSSLGDVFGSEQIPRATREAMTRAQRTSTRHAKKSINGLRLERLLRRYNAEKGLNIPSWANADQIPSINNPNIPNLYQTYIVGKQLPQLARASGKFTDETLSELQRLVAREAGDIDRLNKLRAEHQVSPEYYNQLLDAFRNVYSTGVKTAGIPMRPLLGDTVIGGLLGATSGYAVKEDPTILNRLGITDQKNYSELGALLGVVGGAAIGGRHASKLKALNKAKQIVKAKPKPPKVEVPLPPKVEVPLPPKPPAPKPPAPKEGETPLYVLQMETARQRAKPIVQDINSPGAAEKILAAEHFSGEGIVHGQYAANLELTLQSNAKEVGHIVKGIVKDHGEEMAQTLLRSPSGKKYIMLRHLETQGKLPKEGIVEIQRLEQHLSKYKFEPVPLSDPIKETAKRAPKKLQGRFNEKYPNLPELPSRPRIQTSRSEGKDWYVVHGEDGIPIMKMDKASLGFTGMSIKQIEQAVHRGGYDYLNLHRAVPV